MNLALSQMSATRAYDERFTRGKIDLQSSDVLPGDPIDLVLVIGAQIDAQRVDIQKTL